MKTVYALTAWAAGVLAVAAGDVSGKVTLKGTPPPEKPITPLSADPNCGKLATKPVTTRHYVVGDGAGLANVFVYVKSAATGAVPTEKAVMDQRVCLYEPYVLGAAVGQTVEVRNSDPFLHNVNFMKSASGNETFNFAQGGGAKPVDKVFKNSEVFVKLQCNVHPWMFGYIGVAPHGFFAVTDPSGKFSIKGLPAGKHTLAFVHLKAGEVTQEIEVKDGAVTANAELAAK